MSVRVPIVTCLVVYQDCTNRVPTVYQSSKNSQNIVKTTKMTIGVPVVTSLPRLYQQCTNRQKQSNSKNDHWCTNRHMSAESTEYTKSMSASAVCVCICIRRIHKAVCLHEASLIFQIGLDCHTIIMNTCV